MDVLAGAAVLDDAALWEAALKDVRGRHELLAGIGIGDRNFDESR